MLPNGPGFCNVVSSMCKLTIWNNFKLQLVMAFPIIWLILLTFIKFINQPHFDKREGYEMDATKRS